MIYMENGFNDIGKAYNTRESILRNCDLHWIDRGYSNFLLNMAFISPSEVENIYIS